MSAEHEQRLSRRPAVLALLVLSAFSLILYVDWNGWGLPSHYSWAPDAIHPYAVLHAKEHRFSGGWYDKYPPLQYMLNAAIFAPLLAGMDPKERACLETAEKAFYRDPNASRGLVRYGPERKPLSRLIRTGRGLNAFMGLLLVLGIFFAAREWFGSRTAWFAAVLAVFHPITVFYSHTMNTEAPCFAWAAWGLYFWFRALRRRDPAAFAGLGVCAALAGSTKEQTFALFVFMPFVLAARLAKEEKPDGGRLGAYLRAFLDKRMLTGAAGFIVAVALANNLVFNARGFMQHLAFNAPGVSVIERVHPLTLAGCLGLVEETGAWVAVTLSPALSLLCLVGAVWVFLRHRGKGGAVLLPALSYFLVFIGYIGFLTPRYVTPMSFCLILLGAKALSDLSTSRTVPRSVRWGACGAVILYAAYLGGGTSLLFRNDPRCRAEAWLSAHRSKDTRILAAATPMNTVCRLPQEAKALPVSTLDSLIRNPSLMKRSNADVVVLHIFSANMAGKEPSAFEQAFAGRLRKAGFEAAELCKPDVLHLGKDVPFTHNWGPIAGWGGENQWCGKTPEDKKAYQRRLSPAELREKIKAIKAMVERLHASGVDEVMPYVGAMTVAGDWERRTGL